MKNIFNYSIILFFFIIFPSLTFGLDSNCDKIESDETLGAHSLNCLQKVLENFIFFKSGDESIVFFYSVNVKKNIYVQGSKVGKNYQLEIVSQQYTDILSIKGVKNLVLLGWNLPFEEGSPNFYKIFSLQEIMDGNASKLIVKSFKFYELGSGEDEVATYSIFSTK